MAASITPAIDIYETNDLAPAIGLFQEAFPAFSPNRLRGILGQAGTRCLLASDDADERPSGLAIYNTTRNIDSPEDGAWLYFLAVARQYQRQDIGATMLQACELTTIQSEQSQLSLTSSLGAVAFYKKQGYHMVNEDDRLMTKNLR